jgi:hypothetical protein
METILRPASRLALASKSSVAVASIAAVAEGEMIVTLGLQGKAEPVVAHRITFAG